MFSQLFGISLSVFTTLLDIVPEGRRNIVAMIHAGLSDGEIILLR